MIPWVIPFPSTSHHQDKFPCIFRGLQAKPLFATIAGKGDNPNDAILFDESFSPPLALEFESIFLEKNRFGRRKFYQETVI